MLCGCVHVLLACMGMCVGMPSVHAHLSALMCESVLAFMYVMGCTGEASLVGRLVRGLLECGAQEEDIGLVSPYRAQASVHISGRVLGHSRAHARTHTHTHTRMRTYTYAYTCKLAGT